MLDELKWNLQINSTSQLISKIFKMVVLVVRILVLFYAFICCLSSMHLNHNETDKLALFALKAQIKHDPHHVMDSWNHSIHFCQWQGVTCSPRHHQRVTVLDLDSQNLVGSISPHIGNLSFLKELYLHNNSFSHQIPPQIGHLRRLQVLNLQNNSLTGHIPPNISNCFKLIKLNLGYNYGLVGKIPSEFGSLSKLQMLVFQFNNLTGEIPPSLGNLSSLQVLAALSNNLVGSIPSSLGQLKDLTYFGFGRNMLSGTVPPPIYNFSALGIFDIGDNQLEGSLPSYLGNTLPNLRHFAIFMNQFIGFIPSSISNLTGLVSFEVPENKLSGQLPDFQKLHNLQIFSIQVNNLGSGKNSDLSFLSGLSNATELRWCFIGNNNFGGTLSNFNLSTKLEKLIFQGNQLHGSIPTGIGDLVNLRILGMSNNHFTGNIPTDIGKLQRLEILMIDNNQLSGRIPTTLGNLTMISLLHVGGNNLEGTVPSSLRKCQWLMQLSLSRNNLSGAIPPEVISIPSLSTYLDLSMNHFTGSLPMEVGNLKSLSKFDISNNMLSGELPASLGSCLKLEVLHLQGNFFEGSIPSTMISLKGIQDLDLSRNIFTGEIPQFLKGFVFLKNLNLSFNNFWGAVPSEGVFKNASATSIVGNTRLCGGIVDLQLPKCKSTESNGGGLSHRLKLTIYLVFGIVGITIVLSLLFTRWLRKKRKETALSTLAASFLQVSYTTLLKATDGFSSANLIGVGSFGSVYKGVFDNDRAQLVAVKVFNMLRRGASKSFIAECEALRNIRHRNLVKIITVCSSVDFRGNDFKALVYEFMDKGSLEEWLHPTSTGIEEVRVAPNNLNMNQRLGIAIDVACALDYLHNHCETPIVHCDLKPSNVLLDNELTGHVSDFGLARFLTNSISVSQTSSIGIRGSVGYAAPEYGVGSDVSTYGDVYSFGILLLEMFTGKRPTDDMFIDGLNLHNYVKVALPERVIEIADSILVQVDTNNTTNQRSSTRAQKMEECLSLIFRIGIACSAESPTDRKDMSDVASELHSIRGLLLG